MFHALFGEQLPLDRRQERFSYMHRVLLSRKEHYHGSVFFNSPLKMKYLKHLFSNAKPVIWLAGLCSATHTNWYPSAADYFFSLELNVVKNKAPVPDLVLESRQHKCCVQFTYVQQSIKKCRHISKGQYCTMCLVKEVEAVSWTQRLFLAPLSLKYSRFIDIAVLQSRIGLNLNCL